MHPSITINININFPGNDTSQDAVQVPEDQSANHAAPPPDQFFNKDLTGFSSTVINDKPPGPEAPGAPQTAVPDGNTTTRTSPARGGRTSK